MANKQTEYHRGLNAGLQMAFRMLRDSGHKEAAELVAEEIRKRGVMRITPAVTLKELDHGAEKIEQRMYESFLCQTLMVLYDQFDFGRKRCLRFMDNWGLKTDCIHSHLVFWEDNIKWVKDVLDIDLPVQAMEEGGMFWKEKFKKAGLIV